MNDEITMSWETMDKFLLFKKELEDKGAKAERERILAKVRELKVISNQAGLWNGALEKVEKLLEG